ncbi:hypothetical protein FE257_000886 [Aspergillus nanangensis]|uniref:Uncharacterized protein n=1 Tax=Aspergillus nanangensis TaxID=2582783 RepID=A0AAD4CEF4_ASPNN|nr:hypothetical protein FE257_000886 [Aspergillus nanangensis]
MTSQRKSHVFRVTGLSRALPDEDLQTALQQTLSDNFVDDEPRALQSAETRKGWSRSVNEH